MTKRDYCDPFPDDGLSEEDYYTEEEVKKLVKSIEGFHNWISGQGCPVVKGECCYFSWDVRRYLKFEEKL